VRDNGFDHDSSQPDAPGDKGRVQIKITDDRVMLPRMTKAQWAGIFREAWDLCYSPAHVATVLRRARRWGPSPLT